MSGTNATSLSPAPRAAVRDRVHADDSQREPDGSDRRHGRLTWLLGAAFALFWLAYGLRLAFHDVEHQLLVGDELHAVRVALEYDYDAIWSYYNTSDNSIPYTLYIEWIVEHGWFSELAARFPAIVAGVLLLLTPFLFARWIRPAGALVGMALFATTPLFVYYAIVARPYAPAAFAMTLAVASWASWVTRPRFLPLAGFVVASVAAVFLHLYCLFSVLALLAVAAFASIKGPIRFWPAFGAGLAIGAGIAALYLPGLDGLIEHRIGKVGGGESLVHTLRASSWTVVGELGALAILLPLLALAGWRSMSKRAPVVATGFASVVVLQVVAMCATHPVGELTVFARYFQPVLPVLLLLAAAGVAGLASDGLAIVAARWSPARRSLAAGGVALALGSAIAALPPAKSPMLLFQPWRTSMRSAKESLLDATAYAIYATPVFEYLHRDPESGGRIIVYPGFDLSDHWGIRQMRGLRDLWVVRGADGVHVRHLRESNLAYEHMVDVDDLDAVRATGVRYLVVDLQTAREAVQRRMHHDFGRPVARDGFSLLFDVRERPKPR